MTEFAFVERIQGVLNKLSYKPNWRFCLTPDARLEIRATVPDVTTVRDVFVTVFVSLRFRQEENLTDSMIVMRIKESIRTLELHEMEEWLRFDDEPVDDPHPEYNTRCTCEPTWSEAASYCNLHGQTSIFAEPKPL